MCLSYTKSQPQLPQEKRTFYPSKTGQEAPRTLTIFADFTKNVRFGRLNKVADEEYFRTLKDFKNLKKLTQKTIQIVTKRTLLNFLKKLLRLFYKKNCGRKSITLTSLFRHRRIGNLGLGRKGDLKSNQLDTNVVDRLYMSPISSFVIPPVNKNKNDK
jgi:hypothetical protein